ncbi:hypothetical protein Droror1_Dr00005168 [Drosera rotundifolia]
MRPALAALHPCHHLPPLRPTSSPPFLTIFDSQSHPKSTLFMDKPTSVLSRRDGVGARRQLSARGTKDGDDGIRILEPEDKSLMGRFLSSFFARLFACGLEPALNRLSKWLISGILGTIILWRHDAEALWAIIGSIANAVFSIALKRVLNQERPVSKLRSSSKSDPGMPSSHAQSIFFAVIFIILSTNEALGINFLSLMLSGIIVVTGSYFAWLRVSQEYHTMSQVVVGSVLGLSFAIAWFWLWNTFLLSEFNTSLEVQLLLVVGAAIFAIGFLVYVIRTWFTKED